MESLAAEARIGGATVEVRAFGCDCTGFCEGFENDGCRNRHHLTVNMSEVSDVNG